MKLAAFIMTYEREAILSQTISKIFDQTLPPEEILIIDNSESDKTKMLIESLGGNRITYHKMGYNAGPSGAAKYGLKALAQKGYEWIFWGDDDDPPKKNDIFKSLLKLGQENENIGIIGGLGGKFIPSRARTRNFYNRELQGIVDADYVAGGQMLFVNAEVVKKGVLPTEKLFFGFEELDFCLKVKAANYRIIFDGDRTLKEREARGRTSPNYKWKSKSFGKFEKIWRDYYSIRNMLFILISRNHFVGYLYFFAKNIIKIPLAYRYGFNYGRKVTKVYSTAFWHHLNNNYGYIGKNYF
jgi:glycosyltransferase involved in cell wall biosynthesis